MDNFWFAFFIFGNLVLLSLYLIARDVLNDGQCDHGPSVYDSYCDKCGLDS
jgi:hypothetical protein